jgi:hypothetical protein
VARRKLLAKFRAFLASEEKFWTDMVLELAHDYRLVEAEPAIRALSLTAIDPGDLAESSLPSSVQSDVGRRHSRQHPILFTVKSKKLMFLHKCLISLGDLARYRELHNEKDGRPSAGNPESRRGAPVPRASRRRNFARASEFYRQAKLLLPSEGNPYNQLALLSMYNGDHFESVVHYYRALSVGQPFPTSRENLMRSLRKISAAAQSWEHDIQVGAADNEAAELQTLKCMILELHAYWQHDIQCVLRCNVDGAVLVS